MVFHIEDMEQRARELLLMEKLLVGSASHYKWPRPGSGLSIDLESPEEKSMKFHLDIHEGQRSSSLELSSSELVERKAKFQTRALRQVLVRVDLAKPEEALRHWNPDGTLIVGSHIHFYVENYGDRFAVPLDAQDVICPRDGGRFFSSLFYAFLDACKIEKKLSFELPLEV